MSEMSDKLRKAKKEMSPGGGIHNPDPATDFRQFGKSNRPLDKQIGSGKGDDSRPTDRKKYEDNFDYMTRTTGFGKKRRDRRR
jgi:hypothetical protein